MLLHHNIVYLHCDNKTTDNNKQKHTIMKAIKIKNSIFEVTGERGDFFICKDSKGKVKMFAKKEVVVEDIDSMPKPKVYKTRKSAAKQLNPIEEVASKMMWINSCVYGDRTSMSYQISYDMMTGIELKAKELGNDFIASVCESVIKFMKCSEKQAYCLAKFVEENQISL